MIYDKVKMYADAQGLGITVVEEKAGLGRGTIGKWKSVRGIQIDSLLKVSKVLGVTVSDLIMEEENAVPQA